MRYFIKEEFLEETLSFCEDIKLDPPPVGEVGFVLHDKVARYAFAHVSATALDVLVVGEKSIRTSILTLAIAAKKGKLIQSCKRVRLRFEWCTEAHANRLIGADSTFASLSYKKKVNKHIRGRTKAEIRWTLKNRTTGETLVNVVCDLTPAASVDAKLEEEVRLQFRKFYGGILNHASKTTCVDYSTVASFVIGAFHDVEHTIIVAPGLGYKTLLQEKRVLSQVFLQLVESVGYTPTVKGKQPINGVPFYWSLLK